MRIPHDRTNRPDGALTGHPAALCGLRLVPGYLDREAQESVLAAVREVIARAPLYTPRMPKSGKPMSVRMTNCGTLGWMTDERGYRYQPTRRLQRLCDRVAFHLMGRQRNLHRIPQTILAVRSGRHPQ